MKGFYPESPEDVAGRIRKVLHVSPADKLTVNPDCEASPTPSSSASGGRTSHRLVNTILIDALERRAADIHREPYEHVFRLRLRLDGILHETRTLPRRLEPPVISRLTIMASLDITERRLSQDGRIRLRYPGREADLRVSILPTERSGQAGMLLDVRMCPRGGQGREGADGEPPDRGAVTHRMALSHGAAVRAARQATAHAGKELPWFV